MSEVPPIDHGQPLPPAPAPPRQDASWPAPAHLPYASPAPISADVEHLRLLALFHYILGGITALFSSCALIHFFMGVAMIVNPTMLQSPPGAQQPQPPPPEFLGYMLAAIGGGIVLMGWTVGGLTIYSGRCIAKRRRRLFSQVVAGINCASMPFGTLLGIFTFIVLARPTVRALYPEATPPESSPGNR